MEDVSTTMYRVAIQMGVPDALARRFKSDLKLFKPEWRQAKALLGLGQPQ